MNHSSSITDARTLHRHGRYDVLPRRHEVMWADGSSIDLHLVSVLDAGPPDTFLRAIQHDGRHWVIFDLRDLNKPLDAEIRSHLPRDVPGLVFYTLRHQYRSATEFSAAALAVCRAAWFSAEPVAA